VAAVTVAGAAAAMAGGMALPSRGDDEMAAPAAPSAPVPMLEAAEVNHTPVAATPPAAGVETAAPAAVKPVETSPAPTSSPVAVAQAYALPMAKLHALADGAGLQWVNSDEQKIHAVQAAMAAEPQAIHVPRERVPLVVEDQGSLVLVETRKDLSQLKLPFDTAAE